MTYFRIPGPIKEGLGQRLHCIEVLHVAHSAPKQQIFRIKDHSSIPFHYSIPPFHSTDSKQPGHVGNGPVGILDMQGTRRGWSCWDPGHAGDT